MPALGDRIKVELRRRGWTQAQLADQHDDLVPSTLSRVITGVVTPDLATLDVLSQVLEVPIEELVRLALLDLTGEDRLISFVGDEAARIAALTQSFPWLAPVVEELSRFEPRDQAWILAILEAHNRRLKAEPPTE